MTTIFISGSREIASIPAEFWNRVDGITALDYDIVVGDSEKGVDAQVLGHLAAAGYGKVTVYTIHDRPRVRQLPGSWEIRHVDIAEVQAPGARGGEKGARALETLKDRAMAEAADYGLVAWSSSFVNRFGKPSASKGSLRNMYQLLADGKPVVLYMGRPGDVASQDFSCLELRSLRQLEAVVEDCEDVVRRAFDSIKKSEGGIRSEAPSLFDGLSG